MFQTTRLLAPYHLNGSRLLWTRENEAVHPRTPYLRGLGHWSPPPRREAGEAPLPGQPPLACSLLPIQWKMACLSNHRPRAPMLYTPVSRPLPAAYLNQHGSSHVNKQPRSTDKREKSRAWKKSQEGIKYGLLVNSMNSRNRVPGFKPQLGHLLAMWL